MNPNKVSDHLFNLIQSLSKAEKRHLNLSARRHIRGGVKNEYLKLFDILEKQKVYNTDSIKKAIVRNGLEKRIDKTRSYLFNTIVKSLTAFHSDSSVEAKISTLISGIRVLYSKGLYKGSTGLIKKAKKMAEQIESFSQLLELSDIEDEKVLKSLYEEECITKDRLTILSKIKNLNEINQLRLNLKKNIFDSSSLRSSINEKYLNRLISPLYLKRNMPASVKAKIQYHDVLGAYYFKTSDYERALCQMKIKLDCIEHVPLTNLALLRSYFGTVNNIITSRINLFQFDETAVEMEKLQRLTVNKLVIKNNTLLEEIILQILLFRVRLNVAKAQLEDALQLIPEIELILKKYEQSISDEKKCTFYIYFGYIYFMAENFKRAKKWMNNLENDIGSATRPYIQTLNRLLLMIIYYESGHNELIRYMSSSISRNLIKKGQMYKTEDAILGFFKNELINANSQKELIQAFGKLKVRVTELLKDPFEVRMLNSLDIISWIDSKIENRKLIDILKEKEQERITFGKIIAGSG